jgi:hypothetical protein
MDELTFLDAPTDGAALKTFGDWLNDGDPGSDYCYARAVVLGAKPTRGEDAKPADRTEAQLANAARIAFAQGRVELCQRRCSRGFEYLAQKRRRVRIPYVNGEPWQPRIVKPWIGNNV